MKILQLLPSLLLSMLVSVATADVERGKTLYAQVCFNCHGPALDGGQGPALNDRYWQHGSSPEAILKVIDKGVPGSPMIAYESVFPEADRIAMRNFILSAQEGFRETVRAVYPRAPFQGKRLTSELFDPVKPESQTALPENWYYFERNQDGVLRGTSKLHIKQPGNYHFTIRPIGRTTIYLDGKEVHYSDAKTTKRTHRNETFELAPGVYDFEILHEEKTAHRYRFNGFLVHEGGRKWPLHGRSLQGNIPVIIKAGPEAKVVRKWIAGLPPRTLLCLLPNHVIVAYDVEQGAVIRAWHSAEINQTPSLPDRSTKPSEIRGEPIQDAEAQVSDSERSRFLRYESRGDQVHIVSLTSGKEQAVVIAPDGAQSFTVSLN